MPGIELIADDFGVPDFGVPGGDRRRTGPFEALFLSGATQPELTGYALRCLLQGLLFALPAAGRVDADTARFKNPLRHGLLRDRGVPRR